MVERNYYHRECPYVILDPYRIAALYGLQDDALFHAFKKILVAGQRGGKDKRKDIEEAIWSLQRRLEMWDEDDQIFGGDKPIGESLTDIDNLKLQIMGYETNIANIREKLEDLYEKLDLCSG